MISNIIIHFFPVSMQMRESIFTSMSKLRCLVFPFVVKSSGDVLVKYIIK